MKLYLVNYDEWDYDEHDGAVISAPNPERAVNLALSELRNSHYAIPSVMYIGESTVAEGVILASFNAG